MPFLSGKPQNVIWKPNCRKNNAKPRTTSFLGAVLNSDPVGNAKYVINQVNPLNSNPLNGLAIIGNTFKGRDKYDQSKIVSLGATFLIVYTKFYCFISVSGVQQSCLYQCGKSDSVFGLPSKML